MTQFDRFIVVFDKLYRNNLTVVTEPSFRLRFPVSLP